MKLYRAKKEYMKYLSKIDDKIIDSTHMIGALLRLNELIYFLPIDSPDESDYNNGNLKKTPSIMRMIDMSTNRYYGKCLFSNMFAIPYKELEMIDINAFDKEQSILLEKKCEFIKKNHDRIIKTARMIFKQKMRGYRQEYLKSTVDFIKIETASLQWEIQRYGKHYNRFPDQHYFLINPNTEGVTEYFLMNKKVKVAKICFDNSLQKVIDIQDIYQEEYAPLECLNKGRLEIEYIHSWFRGRGIPSWRDGLDDLLDNLGIKDKDVLLNRAYGLSLSDHYWMNPVERFMEWEDINFFDHDFYSQNFIEASFEDKFLDTRDIDFYSPNNTSDGMLKKAWIVGDDKQRYLLKGSLHRKGLEPFNEILSGMICKVLGLNYVPYTIDVMKHLVLSKCPCFIDKDTEFISAYAILKFVDMNKDELSVMYDYVDELKKHGILNVEEKISKMLILDYILANQDRHLGNFGIVRNVHILDWVDIAPIFDSGQSMCSQKEVYEMDFENVSGCFFNDKNVDFEMILQHAITLYSSIKIDFDELEKIPEYWKEELLKYQYVSMITDEQIDTLVKGLSYRIKKLKKYWMKANNII